MRQMTRLFPSQEGFEIFSLENERQKASEEKGSTTDSSNEEDEENINEMLLNYRDRRLRRRRVIDIRIFFST